MSNAFVDTTVIADILLKKGVRAEAAKQALTRYKRTMLPVYALKEFKAGPLFNFAWAHNKLATFRSMPLVYEAIGKRRQQPSVVGTALEALKDAWPSENLAALTEKYGDNAKLDALVADRARLYLARKIRKAWKSRRSITSDVVQPLPCYREEELVHDDVLIDVKPTACHARCCIPAKLANQLDEVVKVRDAILNLKSARREDTKRAQVLKEIIRKPLAELTNSQCRHIGDAYFALFAPDQSVILTTNTKDHTTLVAPLKKSVEGVVP